VVSFCVGVSITDAEGKREESGRSPRRALKLGHGSLPVGLTVLCSQQLALKQTHDLACSRLAGGVITLALTSCLLVEML
jgi:hypothetical protein